MKRTGHEIKKNQEELFRCINFVCLTFNIHRQFFSYKIDMPGVYIIADENYNILYIGEGLNIYKRLKRPTHPIRKQISDFNLDQFNIVSLIFSNKNIRHRAETILIAALGPRYNKVQYLYGKVGKFRR